MRNHCTPVLVYPRHPAPELSDAHSALTRELNAQSYRILPEDELDPTPHVRHCDLAVLLLGARYDETTRRLADDFKYAAKPFIVWPSPALEKSGAAEQRGFFRYAAMAVRVLERQPSRVALDQNLAFDHFCLFKLALAAPQGNQSCGPL
jgi:hypothetical protein